MASKAVQKAHEELSAARENLAEVRLNFPANSPQRMAAKDRYNRAMRDLALASGTRAPYG